MAQSNTAIDPSQVQWDSIDPSKVQWDSAPAASAGPEPSSPWYLTPKGPVQAAQGAAEAIANWATGGFGQAVGGWRMLLGGGTLEAVRAGQELQKALTVEPQTETGKEYIALPGRALGAAERLLNAGSEALQPGGNGAPVGTWLTRPGETLGEKTFELTGSPALSAAAASLPAAVVAALALRKSAAAAKPDAEAVSGTAPQVQASVGAAGTEESSAVGAGRQMVGGGSAVASSNPYPNLAAEETARGPYPIVKLSKVAQDAPAAEQATRAQIAGDILGEPSRVRSGVVTGNIDTLRSEYEAARAANPTPAGQLLKAKIADEQSSLSDFAQQRVEATGANPHFVNDYQRGDFLNSVMWGPDGIKGYIDTQKKAIYDQAMTAAGNVPVQTANLDGLRLNPQFGAELQLAGQRDFLGGMSNLIDMAKTQGFEGAPAGSVAALERLRQMLNRQWSPDNRYFIGRAVDAIDQDVASAGGPGLLQQARQVHAAEQTMTQSPGIKTLFGDVDPNGVQKATVFEKIPQKLNDMPYDQWRHIYDTFDAVAGGRIPGMSMDVPPELQAAAQQAKNEMAGSIVREVRNAGGQNIGTWNANAANKVMNARAQKLDLALPPEEQQAMHTLNYGGQIMPGQFSYEGAAQQTRRMGQMGLMERNLPQAAQLLGERIPIPGASIAARKGGEFLQGAIVNRRLMKEARELDAQMEANAKLGQ